MENVPTDEYALGIDLGTNSLGWAVIRLIDGEPAGLVRAGVRIFEAGMDESKGIGREESRNKSRRDARLQRRQTWRRARRQKKIFGLLQKLGLLPPGSTSTPGARQNLLNDPDRRVLNSPWFAAKRASGKFSEPDQTMPFILRAAALDEPLEPYFLGRALYHLAQRRGFLSSRKQAARGNDDEGTVKEGISKLRREMEQSGARTVGEFFSRLAPSQKRIRGRWTARDMYQTEFEAIWRAQSSHHPEILTAARKAQLRRAIFFQRPLWFDPNSVGRCELEPRKRRAPAYLLACQRFRLLQTVNNIRVATPGEPEMGLTTADRHKLVDALEAEGGMTFSKARKLLGLTKEYSFNLERGGEKNIKGNRTNADFRAALGDRWTYLPAEEKDRLVEYVHAFQNPEKLLEAAKAKWGLDDEAAQRLSKIDLEPDYLSLSRKAIEKLLPLLEEGVPYGEARKKVYLESFAAGAPASILPPAGFALPEVRNPSVVRSLSELRKVVNAVVRKYGRPAHIRIELARELKKPKKVREKIAEAGRRNEASRAKAKKRILQEAGIADPSATDVRRALLWDECGGICPYTGKSIPYKSLFGPEPQFDIEHIIPFSVSMDNSFQNLTLCDESENRSKHNRTPHQAYAGTPERYSEILERVSRFNGDPAARSAKLRRFKMDDAELEKFLDDFRNRQLNDTSYASRLAARYLAMLYGGLADAEHERRIHTVSGQATYDFRALWQLNSILSDGPTGGGGYVPKFRGDHRHHAVDAVVIGLTDAAMIKRLSDAARRAPAEHRRKFASLQAPWPDFVDSIRAEIGQMVVSHRVSRKVSGALHEETIYSPPKADGKVRVRKSLASLTRKEAEGIADESVKRAVMEKLGGSEPKKVFVDAANLPSLMSADGRTIPIKRVRIKKAVPTFTLGEGGSIRHVTSESNHHVEIYAEVLEGGREGRWDGEVVSMYEAYQRIKRRRPVVQRDHGPLVRFKFSLAPGETLEGRGKNGDRQLYVVRSVSQFATGQIQIGIAPVADARRKKEIAASRNFLRPGPDTLRQWHVRKVVVSPLGEVIEAHD